MRKAAEILGAGPRLRGVPDPNAGGVMTRQGWFSDADLASAQAKVTWSDQGPHVVFPIGYRNVGFDEAGKVIQEPIYPPLGMENTDKRREIAEHDGHTFEARQERYKSERKAFEKSRTDRQGPRRGEW